TRAGQHNHLDVGGAVQGAKQVAQFGVGVEGERVFAFWPVQGQGGYAAFEGIGKVARLVSSQRTELRMHGVVGADVVFHVFSICWFMSVWCCLTLPRSL